MRRAPDSAPAGVHNAVDSEKAEHTQRVGAFKRARRARVSMASDSDDGMSVHTSSTLPPSYHTRHSQLDPFQHALPPLPVHEADSSPRMPPSVYQRNATHSRPASALASEAPREGDGQMPPESRGSEARAFMSAIAGERPRRRTERRVGHGPKQSLDGGVRLDGGPLHHAAPVGLPSTDPHETPTRPPSYRTDER